MGGWSGTVGVFRRASQLVSAVGADALAVHRSPPRSTLTGTSKQAETAADVNTAGAGPALTIRPPRNNATCVVPGGISSTWCVTSTSGAAPGAARQRGET